MGTLINKLVLASLLMGCSIGTYTQAAEVAAVETGKKSENNLRIGGYGQLEYNQQFSSQTQYAGKLDPHRVVLFIGYQFSPTIHLVSEFEVEHGNEFYVEQTYLKYKVNKNFQLRGGVMLIPMGLINESHEPTRFNGVKRPSIDNLLIPTTWRELGIGLRGKDNESAIDYQVYIFNGFNGYDTQTRLTGKDGFRKGRQKALNSYITSPNLAAKINYGGINNLNVGIAGYFGKSQSKMFDKLDKSASEKRTKADSTTVNIAMIGIDAQYKVKGWEFRGEYIHTFIGNTEQYNSFNGKKNDLGSQMMGWYLEASYDLLSTHYLGKKKLVPFIRYESYDTHHKVSGITKNSAYQFDEICAGIGFYPTENVAFKMDYQRRHNAHDSVLNENWFNAGIGYVF